MTPRKTPQVSEHYYVWQVFRHGGMVEVGHVRHRDIAEMIARRFPHSYIVSAGDIVFMHGVELNTDPMEQKRFNFLPVPDPHNEELHDKYMVFRTDLRDLPDEKHHECNYFVLDVTHDERGRRMANAYLETSHTHTCGESCRHDSDCDLHNTSDFFTGRCSCPVVLGENMRPPHLDIVRDPVDEDD